MNFRKIYEQGKVKDKIAYGDLMSLDLKVFPDCGNEFKTNRDWWVITDYNDKILAYCGCLYSEGVCIFVRAWVHKSQRGKGLQRKMIKARIQAAKKQGCNVAITYTMHDNTHSANNLFRMGFEMYTPSYAYAGRGVLYFSKQF